MAGIVHAAKELVTDEAKSAMIDFMKEKVIGRWSEHRAKKFLATFVEEVRKEQDVKTASADLNDMLKEVANKAEVSSALFDAYRRVALSASKDIGPMIIGLLTATIVLAGREASADEEQLFEAAEILNDKDFSAFEAWMSNLHADDRYNESMKESGESGSPQSISVLVRGGSPLPPGVSLDHSTILGLDDMSFDLFKEVGAFALKLKGVGLLAEMTQPRGHPRNPEGTNYFVMVSPACEELYELVHRAQAAS